MGVLEKLLVTKLPDSAIRVTSGGLRNFGYYDIMRRNNNQVSNLNCVVDHDGIDDHLQDHRYVYSITI